MTKRYKRSYWSVSRFTIAPDTKYYLNLEKRVGDKNIALCIEIPFGTYNMIRSKLDYLEKEPLDVRKMLFKED